MANLFTPPGTTTTLTTSATYTDADIEGPLVIQAAAIDIQGQATTAANGYIQLTTHGSLHFESAADAVSAVFMVGSNMSVVFDSTSAAKVFFAGMNYLRGPYLATNSAVTLASNAEIFDFHPTDQLRFFSPAVSFTEADNGVSSNGPPDVLTVTTQDGHTITVNLHTDFDIKATDLIIDNGAIVFRPKQPPIITGLPARQLVTTGKSIDPFAATVITDPNTSLNETVQVVLSPMTEPWSIRTPPPTAAPGTPAPEPTR